MIPMNKLRLLVLVCGTERPLQSPPAISAAAPERCGQRMDAVHQHAARVATGFSRGAMRF